MKKTITILVALLSVLNLFADSQSDKLLESLRSKVNGFGNYAISLNITVDGQTMQGRYEVSGESYHIWTKDIEVFCDGKVRYEVNKLDNEILIDNVDPNDRTILGNPTRMFDFLDGSYSHVFIGKATLKDGDANKVELTKKGERENEKITVYLNANTALPVRISYYMENLNTDAVVEINNIKTRVEIDSTTFSFNPAKYDGFEMIDFR